MSQSKIKHTENVYAFDLNQNEVYILDVPYEERGERKPYFCMGCQRKMQAVYRKIESERHFRHVVIKNDTKPKCTYRDETYRHKLAKEIIQMVGGIKVPRVLVLNPENINEFPLLLTPSTFKTASSVLIERYIYENEFGEIIIGDNNIDPYPGDTDEKFLKIKPDAILLNNEGNPELIIEFVATHKPDQYKLAKLQRLGINAVQMLVPKGSPADIEDAFYTTKFTKWLYNHEQENTDYIQFSKSYTGGIYELDDEQRKLFEEGYLCRKARIGSLIRSIDRIIQGEYYQSIERELKSEISRVKRNSEREKSELERIQDENISTGIGAHRKRRERLTIESKQFQEYAIRLEERYIKRREEIEREQLKVESEIERIRIAKNNLDFGGGNLSEQIVRVEEDIKLERKGTEEIRSTIESEPDRIKIIRELIEEDYRKEEKRIDSEKDEIQHLIQILPEPFESDRIHIERKIEQAGFDETKLSRQFDEEAEELDRQVNTGKIEGNGWLAQEYRKLHSFELAVKEYQLAHEKLRRFEERTGSKG